MVVVQVAKEDISPFACVSAGQWGTVAEDMERSVIVDDGESLRALVFPDGCDSRRDGRHVDVVVGAIAA